MPYVYEIFLNSPNATKVDWAELFSSIGAIVSSFERWQIQVRLVNETIHYYVQSPRSLPSSPGVSKFLLGRHDEGLPSLPELVARPYLNKWADCFLSILQKLFMHGEHLYAANITLAKLGQTTISIYSETMQGACRRDLLLVDPGTFLSINFYKYQSFNYKKVPKYFKIDKVAGCLANVADDAIFEVDTFPYFCDVKGLCHDTYDFTKHSLVLGGSGTGKSRFLASFINHIYQKAPDDYKVVVIDPHDALYQDCSLIKSQRITDFYSARSAIDLFCFAGDDVISNVESILALFKMLIGKNYNGRLERVLRYSAHLLLSTNKFSFLALQKLLKDTDFRNQLISAGRNKLPRSVSHFFLTDFSELKTQYYNDALAPILALVDEMLMVPIFNDDTVSASLRQVVEESFLNIFSLNRLGLGERVVQTIAGLLMQQLFTLAENGLDKHLIIIIDEVAIIEQPILARFLSELRKYKVTVILASQYFAQISQDLRMSIFANVTNYYIFRTSQDDAATLVSHLKVKVANSDDAGEAEKIITNLNNRECLVRVMNWRGEIIPTFKTRVANFAPPPFLRTQLRQANIDEELDKAPELDSCFDIQGYDIGVVSKSFSTSRKVKE